MVVLALAGGGLAIAENPPAEPKSVKIENADTRSLDRFVQEAIREGILTPTNPDGTAPAQRRLGSKPASTERQQAPSSLALRPKYSVTDTVCGAEDPFDFSEYHDLSTYDDLLAWRTGAESAHSDDFKTAMARAYIALGLNEEARLVLDGLTGAEPSALRRLAHMMEYRKEPDTEFFRLQAECSGASGIWYSVALLGIDLNEAAARLDSRMSEFRKLPLQLRIEVAARAVPALDIAGERFVAEKMMANFSEAEIKGSSRLTFNKALLDLKGGGAEAEKAVRNYLAEPRFKEFATAALLQNGHPVGQDVQQAVADKLIGDIERGESFKAVGSSLNVMLEDLDGVAGYSLTLQLADMPATQAPRDRQRIAVHFSDLAEAGLSSPKVLDNLGAMDALLAGTDLLQDAPESDQLFAAAAHRAAEFGLLHLSGTLSSRTADPAELAEARATLAFRMHDHDGLQAFTDQNPENHEIARLAALSAIRKGDKALLAKLEPRLQKNTETLVSMIEMDAAIGGWILPERYYSAASALEDDLSKAAVDRVILLRERRNARPSPRSYTIAEVAPALDRIGRALESSIQGGY